MLLTVILLLFSFSLWTNWAVAILFPSNLTPTVAESTLTLGPSWPFTAMDAIGIRKPGLYHQRKGI